MSAPTTCSAAELGYGRYGNPTWQALEQAIGALEGGRALTFASGMAAAHAVLELLPPGGVIVIPHNCYLGVAEAVDRRAAKYGGQVRRVNVANTTEVLSGSRRRRCGVDRVARQSDDRCSRPSCPGPQSLPTARCSLWTTPSPRRYCSVLWSLAPTSCCTRRPSCFRVIPMCCSAPL